MRRLGPELECNMSIVSSRFCNDSRARECSRGAQAPSHIHLEFCAYPRIAVDSYVAACSSLVAR